MNWQFLVAGIIAAMAALVHTIGGESTNIRHLRRSDVPATEQLELRGVWHAFSIALTLSAAILLVSAFAGAPGMPIGVIQALAVYYALCALVWLVVTVITQVRLLLRVPQWLLLLAIAGFAWWGTL